ncbi:hypothetical protein M422DRAFT_246173 [Sphaerobolus stellatus SS14]|nr:hypothetical protein M422DRAFT_246173 [Sphaerobolus stellatus SS14]
MDPIYNSNIDDICFRTAYGDFLDLLSTQQGLSPEAANMLYIVVSQYPSIGEFLKDGWRANPMETMLNRLGDRMDQRITESFTELRQLGDIPIDLSPGQMNIAKTFVKEFLVEIHRNQLNVADDVIPELRNNPQFKNIFGNATQERKLFKLCQILRHGATTFVSKAHLIASLRSIAREIEERKSDDGGRKPKEPHWWEMVSDLLQRAEKEKELGTDRRSSRWSKYLVAINCVIYLDIDKQIASSRASRTRSPWLQASLSHRPTLKARFFLIKPRLIHLTAQLVQWLDHPICLIWPSIRPSELKVHCKLLQAIGPLGLIIIYHKGIGILAEEPHLGQYPLCVNI